MLLIFFSFPPFYNLQRMSARNTEMTRKLVGYDANSSQRQRNSCPGIQVVYKQKNIGPTLYDLVRIWDV